MSDRKKALDAKLRLITNELQEYLVEATRGEQFHRNRPFPELFELALTAAGRAADQMIEAHLATIGGTDQDIAAKVGAEVKHRTRARLEADGNGFNLGGTSWNRKAVDDLWPKAEAYFNRLEDTVRSRRFDRDSKDTTFDKLIHGAKNHPAIARVILVSVVLSALLGLATAGATVVGWFGSSSEKSSRK